MLEHGGRLRDAAHRYGIALGDWLDLSTGINPHPYPVPQLPADAWQRLPEDGDGLEDAAARYYGTRELLPIAGTQAAIQALPGLIPGDRVTVLDPSYAEHPHAWSGRCVRRCAADGIAARIADTDILVVVNPNNPCGAHFARSTLLDWHRRLSERNGWLIIDEAFIDVDPAASLAGEAGQDGLIVLRSLGKFFGLAGARVGFLLAPSELRRRLAERLGPWAVNGPARHVARTALADAAWQHTMRIRLAAQAERLAALLRGSGLGECTGPALFQWLRLPNAAMVHERLAQQGVLVRLFEHPASLRFGLPASEDGWQRLAAALQNVWQCTRP